MAAPAFKSRGGAGMNTNGRGGRNSGSGGNASLGANSRWSSGPPRQANNNNNANSSANASPAVAPAAAAQAPSAGKNEPSKDQQQQGSARSGATGPQSPTAAFPTLGAPAANSNAQAKMHERMVFLLASLVGTMVVVSARGGNKYVGLLSAASTEQGELGVSLASAQQILRAASGDAVPELGAAKGALIIHGRDLDEIEAYDVSFADLAKESRHSTERDTFRTDTDISKSQFDALGGGRVLQRWSDDPGLDVEEAARAASMGLNGSSNRGNASLGGLEESSGGRSSGGWDQFATNERQFGIKSNYDEDIYTTKLDRSGKDFKERERHAERLAREIQNSSTNNPHLAEERNQVTNHAGTADEEAKYGAVLRGPNAYVPPAMRRAGAGGGLAAPAKSPIPSPSPTANAAGAAAAPKPAEGAAASALPGSTLAAAKANAGAGPSAGNNIKPPTVTLQAGSNDGTPELTAKKAAAGDVSKEFSKFVSSERERMHAKRKEVQKNQMQSELMALKLWHGNFQLKTPTPNNLDSPLRSKAKANVSDKPRDPSLQKSLSPNATHADASRSGFAPIQAVPSTAESNAMRLPPFNRNLGSASNSSALHVKPVAPKMTIAKIPPFNPDKFAARQAALKSGVAGDATDASAVAKAPASGASASTSATAAKPDATTAGPAKLSAKASAFKPFNPNATAFTPGGPSKKPEPAAAPAAPNNPFFGNRILKKPASHAPLHVREEFNPFKVSKVPEAATISETWGFTGKKYRQLFTAVQPAGPVTAPSVTHSEDSFSGPSQQQQQQHPQLPQQQQQQQPTPQPQSGMLPPMPAGMHPVHGPPSTMQPHHLGQQGPHTGPPGHNAGPPQQMNMPFAGQGPYYPQFPRPQQHFPHQQMHIAGQPGIPFGPMHPGFVGGMTFSPPMQHGGHPVYSPQMANMPPPGQHAQFVQHPGPMPGPMQGGPAHGPGGVIPRGGPGGPPPHMQKGPPQMFFQQGGPVHGMQYGHPPQFMPGGPGGRPGMPPMDGNFPGPQQMGDPGNQHM